MGSIHMWENLSCNTNEPLLFQLLYFLNFLAIRSQGYNVKCPKKRTEKVN